MTDRPKSLSKWLLAPVIALLAVIALTAPIVFTPVYEGDNSDHFDGRRFLNIPPERTVKKTFFDVLRWSATRETGPWEQRRDTLLYTPPQHVTDNLRVTMVNHATVLIQADGLNILTDPVWSERVSPIPGLGPHRYRQPGIRFDDLPPVDIVLISHNHYDHMDIATIRRLAQWHDPVFVVPPGNARYLQNHGVDRIAELDWWQSLRVKGVDIHAVAAQHWSRRGLYDTNRALWAGFVIVSSVGNIYFAGDTGMGPHFNLVRARLGPLRLALLPIGAYLPRWFMAPQHIDPAEAVSAHVLLGAQHSMAIHFGTFKLGDDGQDQPVDELLRALRRADIPADQFWIPANGESRLFEITDEKHAQIVAR